MRKKEGKSFTLYLPDDLMRRAKLVADEQDRSTSHVVACALRDYFTRRNAASDAREVSYAGR